jgi:hypothetical protein
MSRGWTCQRTASGKVCKHRNPPRTRKCGKCGKPKPRKRVPSHMAALELDYLGYVALNGGDFCAICGREPSERRRLDRDHDHVTGRRRGLLCVRCNRALPAWMGVEWLVSAVAYLERQTDG